MLSNWKILCPVKHLERATDDQVGTADKSSGKNLWQEKLITLNRFHLVYL